MVLFVLFKSVPPRIITLSIQNTLSILCLSSSDQFTQLQEGIFSLSQGGKYTVSRETGNSFRGVIPNIPYYVMPDFDRKHDRDRYQMHQVCDIDASLATNGVCCPALT